MLVSIKQKVRLKHVDHYEYSIKNVDINLVILKIRNKRTQRKTEMPRGDMILVSTRMVSRIPPHTTKQSKRLKSETKYACRETTQKFSHLLTSLEVNSLFLYK